MIPVQQLLLFLLLCAVGVVVVVIPLAHPPLTQYSDLLLSYDWTLEGEQEEKDDDSVAI
jgi:hypothetical protein